MKKTFFLIFFALVIIAKSQTVPQGINYQAVVRNNTGVVLISSTVNMKFELFNSASGPVIYTETHNGLSTGLVGVVTCSIGMGTTTNNFSVDVNWSNGDVWYQAYLDIGSGMNPVGAKQKFMTVPYSFYAKEVPVVSTGSVLTIGTKTVALYSGPTYTAGVGISIIGGIISNTTSAAVTPTITGAGSTTVSGTYPNLIITTPTISLGGNGIYGGSGALTASVTTVAVGTNTLIFTNGPSSSPIANFASGGAEAIVNISSLGPNPSVLKFNGSGANYGSVKGSANGVTMSAGAFPNTITTSTLGDVWLNSLPSSSSEGRLVINHTASTAYPTMHLKESTTSLNRIKFSNLPVVGKYFEIASQTNAVDGNGAISLNYYNGIIYKPVFLINGDRQVYVNALHMPLSTFHVMTSSVTAPNGIMAEGFNQSGKISIARNNNTGGVLRIAVNNFDTLGRLSFSGYNGTNMVDGAAIRAIATQPFAAFSGTELLFSTTQNGISGLKNVMKITNDSKVLIGSASTIAKLNVFTNIVGEEGIFSEAGSATNNNAIRGTTSGTGNAAFFGIYNPTSSARAIEAQSDAQTETVQIRNTNASAGDAINATSTSGRSIFATNTSGGMSAIEATNSNTGQVITAYKNGGATGRIISVSNNNSANGSEAIYAHTDGGGAAVNASVGSSGFSRTSLLLNEGHLAHHQTFPGFSIGASLSNMTFGPSGATDVAGSIQTSVSTVMPPAFTQSITITFSKTYNGNPPVVVLTPLSSVFSKLDYYVTTLTSGFVVIITNNTSGTLNPPSGTPAFSYHVIGIE